jgi:hypothetical protein
MFSSILISNYNNRCHRFEIFHEVCDRPIAAFIWKPRSIENRDRDRWPQTIGSFFPSPLDISGAAWSS